MDDPIDEMLIDVRASTRGFAADIATMRNSVDGDLVGAFGKAGTILEQGLLTALKNGSVGFDDLKRNALRALDDIASQALQLGLDHIFGGSGAGSSGGSLGNIFGGLVGSLLGLPGRATGGPVSPSRGYLVGERGPEVFVPTSAGRVETMHASSGGARNVRVAIQLSQPRGTTAPVALQRSSRQVASAIRRALITS